jgi:ATP-dependent DNA helicase RecG
MDLHSSLREIKGVGEKTEQLFQKIGVYTLGDILLHFPRTYQEYPQPEDPDEENIGQIVAVCGSLRTPAIFRRGKRMDITLASLFCKNQVVECVWFHMPYIAKQLQVGQPYIFYGRLLKEKQGYKMEQPAIFTPEKYLTLRDSLQPIYSLTKGMTQQMVRKLTLAACDSLADYSEENLPDFVEQREGFPSYMQAIRQVHFPMHFEALAEGRRRLVYQEFFYFILHSRILEAGTTGIENPWHFTETALTDETIQKLPYTLTKGQMDTLSQIRSDLQGPYVSQRLIQGDVGSGKTIVAFLAMLDVVASGYQAAIMAPTEVLAMQHAAGFREMCADYGLPYQVVCLTGSMTASQKKKAYEIIATIPQILVVGTHALIQEKVDYLNLALVVTDEQHRFGVKQRESLSKKGMTPHMLVMSATPIPRTLAMILYGNMQISAIHELPADRIPIKTCVIKEDLRQKAYEMIGRELAGIRRILSVPWWKQASRRRRKM